ncbi:protein kinase family protein [Rhynchospora pubera]|uniref:non-specific serine/threonine protein kinase n=1 Tax=Rhynchospora pubera TaxID=906938 RepID=A0AAV8GPY4_9POAL|nr:protein kinase family protein [Rhynchospora pubera]
MEGGGGEEVLLKKIEELEAGQAILKQQIHIMSHSHCSAEGRARSHSLSPRRPRPRPPRGGTGAGKAALSESHCLRVLQSMGQSVHILDLQATIIFWNHSAHLLYGYSPSEALGNHAIHLLFDSPNHQFATQIFHRVTTAGHSWAGKLPVKNKSGHKFVAFSTITPFYDDDGSLLGMVCVSTDPRLFQFEDVTVPVPAGAAAGAAAGAGGESCSNSAIGIGRWSETEAEAASTPLQAAIASKLTTLATKVTKKVRSRMNGTDRDSSSVGDCYCTDPQMASPDAKDNHSPSSNVNNSSTINSNRNKDHSKYTEEVDGKMGFHKIISSKAEALFAKKGLNWPWKGNETVIGTVHDAKNKFVWPWLQNEQDNNQVQSAGPVSSSDPSPNRGGNSTAKAQNQQTHTHTGSWSSFNANSMSSISSSGSTSGSAANKVDLETDCLDYEILWEDMIIGEHIGQGSCGTVYHALWYGSDVAVKVFSRQEYSDDVILAFRQEVSLMKRLRHPNILLFMGAVTSTQRLCIVTEYLPRGSLFNLLQKNSARLDWRRRIHMALDIARGMNYLHHYNPPIIHRDLKSSNLLVDKNWTVKVADFGLSRLKRDTFLTTKTGKGTPQWMAPEVLRNEPSDEKSDVYSYGVILWELVTQKIPWENLNSIQVIGAVGFMNHRLELPNDVDPQWASIIQSCWESEPQSRPSFQELVEKLRDLLRQYTMQHQLHRSTSGDATEKAAKASIHD